MEDKDKITEEELSVVLPQLFSINLIANEQFEKLIYKFRYEKLLKETSSQRQGEVEKTNDQH
jgi:hypothetical protein